jgi:hypothetical protein
MLSSRKPPTPNAEAPQWESIQNPEVTVYCHITGTRFLSRKITIVTLPNKCPMS